MKQSEFEPNRPAYHTFQGRGTDSERRRIREKISYPIYTCTQSDVTASRAINGTVYQNTSGKIMIVTVSVTMTCDNLETATVTFYCAAANPPTVVKGIVSHFQQAATLSSVNGAITFVVPVNYYYKATASGTGAAAKQSWIEDTLF